MGVFLHASRLIESLPARFLEPGRASPGLTEEIGWEPLAARRSRIISAENRYYDVITQIRKRRSGEQLFRLGDLLNTKGSALLAHVSIMIAVSTALFGFTLQYPSYRSLSKPFLGEILFYLLITFFVLYAVRITGPETFGDVDEERALEDLILIFRRRRLAYQLAHGATMLATAVLFGIVLVDGVHYLQG